LFLAFLLNIRQKRSAAPLQGFIEFMIVHNQKVLIILFILFLNKRKLVLMFAPLLIEVRRKNR